MDKQMSAELILALATYSEFMTVVCEWEVAVRAGKEADNVALFAASQNVRDVRNALNDADGAAFDAACEAEAARIKAEYGVE